MSKLWAFRFLVAACDFVMIALLALSFVAACHVEGRHVIYFLALLAAVRLVRIPLGRAHRAAWHFESHQRFLRILHHTRH